MSFTLHLITHDKKLLKFQDSETYFKFLKKIQTSHYLKNCKIFFNVSNKLLSAQFFTIKISLGFS
jgi:hypothetical protein